MSNKMNFDCLALCIQNTEHSDQRQHHEAAVKQNESCRFAARIDTKKSYLYFSVCEISCRADKFIE